jgi:formamidopyrimidine-DNA glycosylase
MQANKGLQGKCMSKKVPIKAMLLDQAVISGIGNWVGDEVMYDAKMHPEQYCNTLSDEQIEQLHRSIHYVCGTAVDLLGDSEQFPDTWLFKYRWGKGKKDASNILPNGHKIAFLTVGGRTSAVVPALQKKTGPVAKEMDEAVDDEKPKKASKKRKVEVEDEEEDAEDLKPIPKPKTKKNKADPDDDVKPVVKKARVNKKASDMKEEDTPTSNGHVNSTSVPKTAKKGKGETNGIKKVLKSPVSKKKEVAEETGRRRSGRASRT